MALGLQAGYGLRAAFEALKQRRVEDALNQERERAQAEREFQRTLDLRRIAEAERSNLAGETLTERRIGLDDKGLTHRIEQDKFSNANTAEDRAREAAERARADALIEQIQDNAAKRALALQRVGVSGANRSLFLTPIERGTEAGQAAGAEWDAGAKRVATEGARIEGDQQVRVSSARSANAQEPLVSVIGPDGNAMLVPRSQAAGMSPATARKPVLGAERQALAYFNRAKTASDEIAPLEEEISKMGLGGQVRMAMAPNFMQSQTGQAYRQAQRAFTEARLRKESGAAIPQGEYDNDARTYFAQIGDSPETIAQKRRARAEVLDGLAFASGTAYREFYGKDHERMGATGSGDGGTVEYIRGADGKLKPKGGG